MSAFGRDINHDYVLYHLSSSKPVNREDVDKRFSFVEVLGTGRSIRRIRSGPSKSKQKEVASNCVHRTKCLNDFYEKVLLSIEIHWVNYLHFQLNMLKPSILLKHCATHCPRFHFCLAHPDGTLRSDQKNDFKNIIWLSCTYGPRYTNNKNDNVNLEAIRKYPIRIRESFFSSILLFRSSIECERGKQAKANQISEFPNSMKPSR